MEACDLDPTVALAALDLEIGLVEETRLKMIAGTGKWVGNNDSPEGTAFVLKELAAEKARYEEERRALLEKIEPRRPSAEGAAPTPPPATLPAPAAPPEPCPEPAAAEPSREPALSAEYTADQKSAAQTTVMWMDAVTLGTYDAPRRAADLYAPDGVLWGTEVYGPDDPLWGTVLELVRNTPEQIYAYYDHFARLPKLRVVEYTPGPVRVHGDFAAQDGAHRFSWQGVDGSTVEMRARFSLTFRRVAGPGDGGDGDGGGDGHPWEIVEHCSFSMPTAPPAGELTLKEVGSKAAAAATDEDITGDVTKKHHRQQKRQQKPPQTDQERRQQQQQQQQRQAGADVSAAAAQAITTAPSSPLVSPSLQVSADAVTPDGSSASVRDSSLRPPPSPSTFFSDSTTAAATKAAAASKAAAATKAAGSQGYWSFILNRYVWKPKAPPAAGAAAGKRRGRGGDRQGNGEDPALEASAKRRIDELRQRAEIAEIRAAELAALLAKERAAIRRAVQQTRAAAPKYLPNVQKPEAEEQKQEKEKKEDVSHQDAEKPAAVVPAAEAAPSEADESAEPAGVEGVVKQEAGGSGGGGQARPPTNAGASASSATATAAMATATAATATATAATATATAATATATAATATATAANASAAQGRESGGRRNSRASAARLGERVEKARYLAAELAKQMREIEERAASLAECDRAVAAARSSSSTGIVHGGSLSPSLDEQHPKMLV